MLTCCLVLCLQAAPAQEKVDLPPQRILENVSTIKNLVGEKVEYDGYVNKAGIWVQVGTSTFSVVEEGASDKEIVLRASAKGGKFGYSLKALMESRLDPATCVPRTHTFTQSGSEQQDKRLLFENGRVLYVKKKHCRDPQCKNPAHMVKETTFWGPIPTGSKTVHCSHCQDRSHYVWLPRYTHEVDTAFLDMLTALFAARSAELKVGTSIVVPLVIDRDRWAITVTSQKEERIEVKAGKFTCVKVTLQPENVRDPDRRTQEQFQGIFGLNGTINVWLDKETRLPVQISGSIPFAFMNLNCHVELRKIVTRSDAAKKARSVTAAVPQTAAGTADKAQ
jgi:hypothetical protein